MDIILLPMIICILSVLFIKPNKWQVLYKTQKLYNKLGDKEYYPIICEDRKTDYGRILRLKCPVGVTSYDFIKCQNAIEEMLNARVDISFNNGFVFIKVFENVLSKMYIYKRIELESVKIPIGYSYRGLETADLSQSEPHMLVAGETGSGKSTFLRCAITNIIINNTDIELHLIDLKKGVEFQVFKDCEIVKSFSRTLTEAYETLQKIKNEVNRRYELFYDNNCISFNQYVKRHKLKRWLVIVDEFSIIARDKNSVEIFEELSAIARACGIHLILCTQRPDAKIITGLIKQNIPLVVGLKCLNGVNSRIVIDENGLEKLRGQGHGILKRSGELLEFQSMYLDENKVAKLIKPFEVLKKEVAKPKRDPFEVFNDN